MNNSLLHVIITVLLFYKYPAQILQEIAVEALISFQVIDYC
jgi:hypothetical protein